MKGPKKWGRIPAYLRPSRRAELLERDGADCFYCLKPLHADQSIEHIRDREHGGGHALANTALAHAGCNIAAIGLTVDQKMLRRGDALLARLAGEPAPWMEGTRAKNARVEGPCGQRAAHGTAFGGQP